MKNLFKSISILLLLSSTLKLTAQVPVLNSYPSASAVIFLDFDGHNVSGTSWNYYDTIVCGASTLNSSQITQIFNRVSEDYRPFNLNITTDSTKYWSAPANKRTRVILTVSSSWYGSSGGVAFMGSFTWGDNTPCFVFTALLGNNVKNISEAASHEAGHTLGLAHQSVYAANCQKTSDYNYGTGTGEIGWAPIMGVGYYQNFTLWHNGPNSYGCNSNQSDLSILSGATNGFGFRPDDYSDVAATAGAASFTADQFTVNGIIETTGDKDLFTFTQPSFGNFKLDAIPYSVGAGNAGSDLDMQITLLNSAQVILGSYNPGAELNSVIDTMLNSGTYYLRVEGRGNIYALAYASLGSYALQGKFTAGNALPLRRLELNGSLQNSKHSLNWTIDADEKVEKLLVEVATDGKNFAPLTQTANDAHAFAYKPATPATSQYRLNVTFDNGHQYYSNIVTIRQTGSAPAPHLVSNIVTSNLKISSPGTYTFTILDLTGKTISRGQLTNGTNTVNSAGLINGLYMIHYSNGEGQLTEKFIKQ